MKRLDLNSQLLDIIIDGTHEALTMTDLKPPAIGASRLVSVARPYAVIFGLVGEDSGSMTLSLSEPAMLFIASRFLDEPIDKISDVVFDAAMEVGNLIAGCIKHRLVGAEFNIDNISLPAMVLGANYHVYQSRKVNTCSVEFEIEEMPAYLHNVRFFSVAVSLRR